MPDERRHARQRRPDAQTRGWLTTTEYAAARERSPRTVRLWCQQGRVWDRRGRPVAVEGGDGRDYRIPLEAVSDERIVRAA